MDRRKVDAGGRRRFQDPSQNPERLNLKTRFCAFCGVYVPRSEYKDCLMVEGAKLIHRECAERRGL